MPVNTSNYPAAPVPFTINQRRPPAVRRFPYAIYAICIGAAVTYLVSASHYALPALFILALLLPITLTLVPRSRPDWRQLLTPHNMVIIFFLLEVFGEPLNLTVFDAYSLIPRHIHATDSAVNGVLMLLGCAFVGYVIGYSLSAGRARQPREARASVTQNLIRGELGIVVCFIALGCLSLYLYYDGISLYLYHLSHPEGHKELAANLSSTWQGVSGVLLKPFLTFGIVGSWCYAIDRLPNATRVLSATVLTVAVLPLIVLASASFNRASMLVPVVGVLTVFSNRIRRLPLVAFTVILGMLLLLAASWATYRSGKTALAEFQLLDQLGKAPTSLEAELSDILVTSTALHRLDTAGEPPCCRFTLIDSVLSPIPVLGKRFRDNSGQTVYNKLIYGDVSVADQVIPFYFELFYNLHLPGVFIGYFFLGKAIYYLQTLYLASNNTCAIREFSIFMLSFWVALLSIYSIGVLSQILLYSLCPAYIILWITRKHKAQTGSAAVKYCLRTQHQRA